MKQTGINLFEVRALGLFKKIDYSLRTIYTSQLSSSGDQKYIFSKSPWTVDKLQLLKIGSEKQKHPKLLKTY